MKKAALLIFFTFAVVVKLLAQTPSAAVTVKEYRNYPFKFILSVPDNWKLYLEFGKDSVAHTALADWELPKVYSELEKANIANAISVTAYKQQSIGSVEDLIRIELAKMHAEAETDKTNPNARIIYPMWHGLRYKVKLVFVYKNGIGYVINFTATPGTYDINLPTFEEFNKTIRYE